TGKCRLVSGGGLGSQDETSQRVWLKQLVAERVAGIVVAPVGGQKLLKQLAKARKKGITVVNIGGRFDPEMLTRNRLLIPWVGPDNSAAARAVAQLLVQRLRPEARVAILAGTPGHQVSYERVRAARAWLKSCGLKVVAIEAAHWQKGRAEATTMDLLSRFPDLDAILAVNDEMALGALKAVGRVKPGRVLITGFDGEKRALNLIRAGKMLATIDWYPDQQGVYGIQKLLSGTAGDKMTPWRLLIREDLVGHGFEIGSTGTDQ
ncbi:MAG: substrate-binding domain-containing protein, partial [Desulfovibrionales bacterium]|nr:substrate-binding domain-containing protein [Desulfovibrionales bacterium]